MALPGVDPNPALLDSIHALGVSGRYDDPETVKRPGKTDSYRAATLLTHLPQASQWPTELT